MTSVAAVSLSPQIDSHVATAVRKGLSASRRSLPAWLFYDEAGSELFEQITELPEYYLTRTERTILAGHAAEILARAAGETDAGKKPATPQTGTLLRIAELGAGSADKTRLLLNAAVERQGRVIYEPVDVSPSALEVACERIEREIPGVEVLPRVADYTREFELDVAHCAERRLVLYIGSSIGNFEPLEAEALLKVVAGGLRSGDAMLLGVDLRKSEETLIAAYDDAAGVTARFNLNILARLNEELDADFDLENFAHCAVWNDEESRIEMHLKSECAQTVRVAALDLEVEFAEGETIHTENSYKYAPGQAEEMLAAAGFAHEATWTDAKGWFAVILARKA